MFKYLCFLFVIGLAGSGCFVSNVFSQSAMDSTTADSLKTIGADLQHSGHYDSALAVFETASDLYESLEDWPNHLWCLRQIARNFELLGRYGESLEYLEKALSTGLKTVGKTNPAIAEIYQGMGIVYYYDSNFEECVEFFQKSLDLKLETLGENHPSVANDYNAFSIVYRALGDFDRALDYQEKAVQIRMAQPEIDSLAIARYYNNMGTVFVDKTDYYHALQFFNKSLALKQSLFSQEHLSISKSLNNIGNVYFYEHRFDLAEDYYSRALQIKLKLQGENHHVVSSYENLGKVQFKRGNFDAALGNYRKAMAIVLELFGEDNIEAARLHLGIGQALMEKGELDEAGQHFATALGVHEKLMGSKGTELALNYEMLSDLEVKRGRLEAALDLIQKALISLVPDFEESDIDKNPALENVDFQGDLLVALSKKAGLAYRVFKKTTAREYLELSVSTFDLAVTLTDQVRIGFKSEGSRFFLGEEVADMFEAAIEASLALGDLTGEDRFTAKAFYFVEKGKSNVLLASYLDAEAKQFGGIPDSLIEAEKSLKLQLAYAETRLLKAAAASNPDSLKVRHLRNQLFEFSKRHSDMIDAFEAEFPEYHQLRYQTRVASIAEIQEYLDPHTALIEYYVGSDEIFVFLIRKNGVFTDRIEAAADLGQLVTRFRRSIKKIEKNTYLETGPKLHELLLGRVVGNLSGVSRLTIVPHAVLNYVPFEALTPSGGASEIADFSKLKYPVRDFDISYHYSATLLLGLSNRGRKSRPDGIAGFAPVFGDSSDQGTLIGNQLALLDTASDVYRSVTVDGVHFSALPYSEKEVASVVSLFEKKGLPGSAFIHEEANETNFRDQVRDFKFIHIATHGLLNEEEPKLSGIIFSPTTDGSKQNDGVLFENELYGLNLEADLVVLSSCESGIGKIVRGEGPMALTRGFLFSGADNVVISLWKVLDKNTSRFMVSFYKNILDGQSYSASLRSAKLDMIDDAATAFPSNWAGFVLIGR